MADIPNRLSYKRHASGTVRLPFAGTIFVEWDGAAEPMAFRHAKRDAEHLFGWRRWSAIWSPAAAWRPSGEGSGGRS